MTNGQDRKGTMAASVAGIMVLAVFLVGGLMVLRTSIFGDVPLGNAVKEAVDLEGERARTVIDLGSPSIDTGDGTCTLTVTGDNDGSISIGDFSLMDVIVQTLEGNNAPVQLNYTTGDTPTSTGDWAKELPSTLDVFAPGIFDPGDTITIKARLDLSTAGDTAATVTVGTPNGVTDTRSFTAVTPCP